MVSGCMCVHTPHSSMPFTPFLQALGHSCLNQDEFGVTVADLQKEIRQQWSRSLCGNNRRSQPSAVGDAEAALQQQQQPPREPALYLRMMVDLLRVTHTHQNAVPLEFICPLTTAIMIEPVLLHETGHSYEVRLRCMATHICSHTAGGCVAPVMLRCACAARVWVS